MPDNQTSEMLNMGGIALLVIGSIFFLYLLRQLILALRSNSWTSVQGEIISAGTQRVESSSANVHQRGSAAATLVDYSYRYEVRGVSYDGTRVTFSDAIVKNRAALDKLLGDFKAGDKLPVYFDPSNPAVSVLQTGPGIANFTPFITPALLLGVGVWLVFYTPLQ